MMKMIDGHYNVLICVFFHETKGIAITIIWGQYGQPQRHHKLQWPSLGHTEYTGIHFVGVASGDGQKQTMRRQYPSLIRILASEQWNPFSPARLAMLSPVTPTKTKTNLDLANTFEKVNIIETYQVFVPIDVEYKWLYHLKPKFGPR